MQIIISANEEILAITANTKAAVSEDMEEEAYWNWLRGAGKDENGNTEGLQKIPV